MQTHERQYWNIVKGIGIVLVVLGHMQLPCWGYIYLFHLPLFFFVSGYLYNEEKYGDKPYLYVAARIKSSWVKCIFLYWIVILLHNTFYTYKIWDVATAPYSMEEICVHLSRAVFGDVNELFAGPLWFVPVLVMASCVLGFTITLSRLVERITRFTILKYLTQAVVIISCGLIGYSLYIHHVELMVHMQVVPLVMPFLWGGYLLRSSKIPFEKYLNPLIAILFAIIIYFVSLHEHLELIFMLVYPYMHLIAFLGIYMCLYLAKFVQRFIIMGRVFEWLGKASFWIMFIHFPSLLLFDWAYTKIQYPENPERYLQIMASYPELWPVYLLVGIALPLLEYVAHVKVKGFVSKKIKIVEKRD